MKIYSNPSQAELKELLKRPTFERSGLEAKVQSILDDVKSRGDEALKEYAEKFDGVVLNDLLVSEEEFAEASSLVDDELKAAIETAKNNIEKFPTQPKTTLKTFTACELVY